MTHMKRKHSNTVNGNSNEKNKTTMSSPISSSFVRSRFDVSIHSKDSQSVCRCYSSTTTTATAAGQSDSNAGRTETLRLSVLLVDDEIHLLDLQTSDTKTRVLSENRSQVFDRRSNDTKSRGDSEAEVDVKYATLLIN